MKRNQFKDPLKTKRRMRMEAAEAAAKKAPKKAPKKAAKAG